MGPDADSGDRVVEAGADRRPRGPEDVTNAVINAAIRLIARRGPSAVSLRDIASEARVNYGLIHHYFGTKDEVLRTVFRTLSAGYAGRLADVDEIHPMLEMFWQSGPGAETYSRMLAWMLLEGRDPEQFIGRSPVASRLVDALSKAQVEAAGTGPEGSPPVVGQVFDPRLLTAVIILLSTGWRLFSPFLVAAADLHDRPADDLRSEIRELLDLLIDGVITHRRPPGPS